MIKRWIEEKKENDPAALYYAGMILFLLCAFLVNTVLAVIYGA